MNQSFNAKVIRAYQSSNPDPLILEAGANLIVEERETKWPGWLWGQDSSGKGSWVPFGYLIRDGSKAVLNRTYNATELSIKVGETLEVFNEEAGWYWCLNREGRSGWVPAENVKRAE